MSSFNVVARFFGSKRSQIALRLFVVGLGLISCLAFVFNSSFLRFVGAVSASSPLPVVFSEVLGYEPFATDVHFQIRSRSLKNYSRLLSSRHVAQISSYESFRSVFRNSVLLAPRLSREYVERSLQELACNQNYLARVFDINEPIVSATMNLRSKTTGHLEQWNWEVRCRE
jgi:hypothetical protein